MKEEDDEEQYSSKTSSATDFERPNLILDLDDLGKSPREELRFSLRKPSIEKSASSSRRKESTASLNVKRPSSKNRRPESELSMIPTDIELPSEKNAKSKKKEKGKHGSVSEKSHKSRTYRVRNL